MVPAKGSACGKTSSSSKLDMDRIHPWIGLDWIGLDWIGLGVTPFLTSNYRSTVDAVSFKL